MAYITRFYDDNDVIAKLREVRPDISFGEKARVVNIGVEPPIENSARVVMVELAIPLSNEEFDRVFATPKD